MWVWISRVVLWVIVVCFLPQCVLSLQMSTPNVSRLRPGFKLYFGWVGLILNVNNTNAMPILVSIWFKNESSNRLSIWTEQLYIMCVCYSISKVSWHIRWPCWSSYDPIDLNHVRFVILLQRCYCTSSHKHPYSAPVRLWCPEFQSKNLQHYLHLLLHHLLLHYYSSSQATARDPVATECWMTGGT